MHRLLVHWLPSQQILIKCTLYTVSHAHISQLLRRGYTFRIWHCLHLNVFPQNEHSKRQGYSE
jgi:hypothetical protein